MLILSIMQDSIAVFLVFRTRGFGLLRERPWLVWQISTMIALTSTKIIGYNSHAFYLFYNGVVDCRQFKQGHVSDSATESRLSAPIAVFDLSELAIRVFSKDL